MSFFIIKDKSVLGRCIAEIVGYEGVCSVEIKAYSKNRSNPQNRYYWAITAIIANEKGYTKDELHDEFRLHFLGTEKKTSFGGAEYEVIKSSTKLTTKEFGEYLDKILVFAMNENIRLPTADYYGEVLPDKKLKGTG